MPWLFNQQIREYFWRCHINFKSIYLSRILRSILMTAAKNVSPFPSSATGGAAAAAAAASSAEA